MVTTLNEEQNQNQERALLLWEQGHTYKQVAAEMGITVGAARYRVQCARRRLGQSPRLADMLRIHPDWMYAARYVDEVMGLDLPAHWFYLPNIPDEVVWCNAYGSEIIPTENGGYTVKLPYAEYEDHPLGRMFPSTVGSAPIAEERHYLNDQTVIEDLGIIQGWKYPDSLKRK